jgi:hypothetical protein
VARFFHRRGAERGETAWRSLLAAAKVPAFLRALRG